MFLQVDQRHTIVPPGRCEVAHLNNDQNPNPGLKQELHRVGFQRVLQFCRLAAHPQMSTAPGTTANRCKWSSAARSAKEQLRFLQGDVPSSGKDVTQANAERVLGTYPVSWVSTDTQMRYACGLAPP